MENGNKVKSETDLSEITGDERQNGITGNQSQNEITDNQRQNTIIGDEGPEEDELEEQSNTAAPPTFKENFPIKQINEKNEKHITIAILDDSPQTLTMNTLFLKKEVPNMTTQGVTLHIKTYLIKEPDAQKNHDEFIRDINNGRIDGFITDQQMEGGFSGNEVIQEVLDLKGKRIPMILNSSEEEFRNKPQITDNKNVEFFHKSNENKAPKIIELLEAATVNKYKQLETGFTKNTTKTPEANKFCCLKEQVIKKEKRIELLTTQEQNKIKQAEPKGNSPHM